MPKIKRQTHEMYFKLFKPGVKIRYMKKYSDYDIRSYHGIIIDSDGENKKIHVYDTRFGAESEKLTFLVAPLELIIIN